MAITITCPCNPKSLRLKDVFAGKRVKCPRCGKSLQVPGSANGFTTNGHAPPAAEGSPFDFSDLAATPASPPAAETPISAPVPEAPPPAPAAQAAPSAPAGEAAPPALDGETKPAPGKRLAALVAVLAAFLLLVGGLVLTVFLLLNQPGDGKGSGDGTDLADAQGNKDSKLTREEEERIKVSELKKQKQAQVVASQKAAAEAKRKKQQKEEQDAKLRKEKIEAAAIAKAEQDAKLRREKQDAALAKADRDAKLKLEAEKQAAALAKQRAAQAEKLVIDAQAALARKELDKAGKLFLEANRLAPTNQDAKLGLDKVNQQQRVIQAAKLSQEGRDNLTAKKYILAVSQLERATQLDPNDEAAARALKKARAEQAKLDKEVERLLTRGRKALKRHDFKGAARAIDAADKVAPGHPAVLAARQELANERNRVLLAAETKKRNRAQADEHIKKARAALKKDQYAEAEQHALSATRLVPGDVIAKSLLMQARDGLNRLGAEAKRKQRAEERKQREKFRKEAAALVKKGRQELDDKLFQEAFNDLSRANVLVPKDRVTLALLKRAQKGLNDIQLARAKALKKSEQERKRREDAKRAEQVRLLLDRARKAFADKKYDDADKFLAELRRLAPNDPDVTSLLKDLALVRKAETDARKAAEEKLAAERARAAAKAAAEAARKKLLAAFDSQMTAGQKALKGKKFDGAIKQFSGALRLVQDDKDSADLAKKARQAITDARKAKEIDAKLKLKIDP